MATAMPLGQVPGMRHLGQAGAGPEAGILKPMPQEFVRHIYPYPDPVISIYFRVSGSTSGLSSPQAGALQFSMMGYFLGPFFGSDSVEFFQCLSSQLSLALHLLFLFISLFFFLLSVTKLAWAAVAVAVSVALLPPRSWRLCWRRQNASESAVLVSFKLLIPPHLDYPSLKPWLMFILNA